MLCEVVKSKMEMMKYSGNFSAPEKNEIQFILGTLLPECCYVYITDFMIAKRSVVFGETKFTSTFRVNIDSGDTIDHFINEFGQKSGTTYNHFRGDRKGKNVVLSGIYSSCMI